MSRQGSSSDERQRMLAENARRRQLGGDRYAPWSRAERLMVDGRRRLAAEMLQQAGAFPGASTRCLEVGFGDGGWLVDLLAFRVRESSLYGVEIDWSRAFAVKDRLPATGLAVVDGSSLPWRSDSFEIVVASTVFTSILDPGMQQQAAIEISRVLTPGGVLLWYDFAINNPRNPNVRGVSRKRLGELFPDFTGDVRSVTLAPPILRRIASWSIPLAELLAAIPGLRTHLLGVLKKPHGNRTPS